MTFSAASSANPMVDLQESLQALRTHTATNRTNTDIDRLLWNVSAAAEQILAEHNGMAEELLGVYEQLGIVFEVIRNLSTVQNEPEVVELFLASLRRSFDGRWVSAVRPSESGAWATGGDGLEITSWLEALIQRARTERIVLVDQPAEEDSREAFAEVMVGPVFAGDTFVCSIVIGRTKSVPAFRASDMSLIETLTVFCGDLIRTHRLVHELREMSVTMVRSLVGAVDQKDEYTSGHSMRVGYFATILGKAVNLQKAELQMLQWSALLHDVGKIGIRDEVLKKRGRLTDEEMAHMKEHPVRSHKVVQGVPQLAKALDGVLHHHEHYDGTGYPDGLVGEDIPLQARIVQIADIFDALTSNRSYRNAFDWSKALAILDEEAGSVVDPGLAKIFDRLIRSRVEGRPDAWERLIATAGKFGSLRDDEFLDPEGA